MRRRKTPAARDTSEKQQKIERKPLAIAGGFLYTGIRCDMIAMKREVAANWQVFRGANVKKPAVTRLDETDDKSLYKQ